MKVHPHSRALQNRSRQEGYVLIVMMLFLTLIAIGLTAMAPAITQSIRREREIELIHRGRQYARAIRLYYRKFGRYPVRLEDLENTNNIRFLRKRYKDPMTPGGQWRLIHYGEAQLTTPNGPVLPGATTPGGAASGVASAGASSAFASTFSLGSQSTTGQTGTAPGQMTSGQMNPTPGQMNPSPGGLGSGIAQGTAPGQAGAAVAGSESSQSSPPGAQSGQSGQPGQPGTPASLISSSIGNGPAFGGGPIVGVASTSKKQSIKVLNKKDHYNDWEFVYDPTLDLTMAQPVAGVGNQPNQISPGVQVSPGFQPGPTPGMGGMQPTKPQ